MRHEGDPEKWVRENETDKREKRGGTMKKVGKTAFVLGTFLLAFTVIAADLGTIEGRVTHERTGEPLPSVNIIIKGTTLGTATDKEGEYSIVNVPVGPHRAIASMMGYKSVSKEVEVSPRQTIRMDFKLKQTLLEVGGVVVTATRTPRYIKDVPVRTQVITSKAMEDKGAANLYEALVGSPGIRVEQQCQFCNFSMLRLQGLGPDHTQILVDGQPVYSGLASVYGLEQTATAAIDRIEVVKGAGSSLYGAGAVAGGVNIVTRRPSQKPEAKVELELGTHNTNRYYFTGSTRMDDVGLILFAQKDEGDAIDQTRDGEISDEVKGTDGISDRVKRDATNAGFRVVVENLFGGDRVTLSGKGLHELRQGGRLDEDTYENPFTEGTERIITKRYEAEAIYGRRFLYGNRVNISFSYARHYRNATNDTYLGDYMATHGDTLPALDEMRPYLAYENLYSLNLNYLHPFLGTHRLLTGVQYSRHELEESGKYVVVDEDDENHGESYTSTSEKHADELGVYIQDELSINDVLELVAGARYDYHRSEDNFRGSGKVAPEGVEPVKYDETSINPRFAAKFQLLSHLTLRGSVGTGFRIPYGFSEDLHLCSGSPRVWKGTDLKPEKSISYNLSVDYEMDNFSLGANIYRTNLDNKIDFVDASEEAARLGYTYQWENIGKAYVQGVEVTIGFSPVEYCALEANFTVNDGQYDQKRRDWEGTDYFEDSKYISRLPVYTAGAKLRFAPGNWSFVLDGDYQGPLYIDYFIEDEEPTKIKETEPYLTVNAKVSRHFFDKFTVYLGAKNLTDYIQPEKHTDDAAFMYAPMYGRIVYWGTSVSL